MSAVAIVAARFYEALAERLTSSARQALDEAGHEATDVFEVPGAFELPMAAKLLTERGTYAGIVLVGAVIYEHVCAETARGIMQVQLETGTPCGFGLVTVDRYEQALARSGGSKRDVGRNAAQAVIELLAIRQASPAGA